MRILLCIPVARILWDFDFLRGLAPGCLDGFSIERYDKKRESTLKSCGGSCCGNLSIHQFAYDKPLIAETREEMIQMLGYISTSSSEY